MNEIIITIIIAIICMIVIIYVLRGFRIVSQSETMIIERLGKYNRALRSGINIVLPILEKPRSIKTRFVREDVNGMVHIINRSLYKIDLREQVYDFPRQNVITKDNVQTEINALLYFQIVDPVDAVYEIDNLPNAIEKLTQTTLRNVIGELELDETLTSRDTINARLRTVLDEATSKWGVKVNRVELQDITPPERVRRAMEQQMQAERKRRADILNAEGEKQSAILRSEGEKQSLINEASAMKESEILKAEGLAKSKIMQAEAEAESIRQIAEAVAQTNTNPTTYVLALKYIETLKELTSGKDNKTIYLPYEATNLLGSIGGIKDLFDVKSTTPTK